MTFAAAVQYPNVRPVVLATVTAGLRLTAWTATGAPYSSTYWVAMPFKVTAVRHNLSSMMTAASSLSNCNSTNLSFWYDSAAKRLYINPNSATPYAEIYNAVVTFSWSNHARDVAGVPFDERLAVYPSLNLSIPSRFTVQETSAGGTIEVEQAQGNSPTDSGFFDEYQDLNFDAGAVIVQLAADYFR